MYACVRGGRMLWVHRRERLQRLDCAGCEGSHIQWRCRLEDEGGSTCNRREPYTRRGHTKHMYAHQSKIVANSFQ